MADDVEEDAWPVFFQRLRSAESDLLWAAELMPDDPEPHGRISEIGIVSGCWRRISVGNGNPVALDIDFRRDIGSARGIRCRAIDR